MSNLIEDLGDGVYTLIVILFVIIVFFLFIYGTKQMNSISSESVNESINNVVESEGESFNWILLAFDIAGIIVITFGIIYFIRKRRGD